MFESNDQHSLEAEFGLNESLFESDIDRYSLQSGLTQQIDESAKQIDRLSQDLCHTFSVNLNMCDYIVSAAAGIMLGIGNALFKDYIPQKGGLKHKHGTTRSAVDYKVPKPGRHKGSVQSLHRQVGPGHDIFRFKEALDLMAGKTDTFPLWGSSAKILTGGTLHPGGMSLDAFLVAGGFRIPEDPKTELINHLLIDFFTKTSLPIPGTTFIADKNEFLAKAMFQMYDEGFNLKNTLGNSLATAVLQFIMHGYALLFKAMPSISLEINWKNPKTILPYMAELAERKSSYSKSNEFHVQEMVAHGSSFLIDTAISTASKNVGGLLSLNYGSLVICTKHTLQYLIQSKEKYSTAQASLNKEMSGLQTSQELWYEGFRDNFLAIAERDGFVEVLDAELQIADHEKMVEALSTTSNTLKKRSMLIQELREAGGDIEAK